MNRIARNSFTAGKPVRWIAAAAVAAAFGFLAGVATAAPATSGASWSSAVAISPTNQPDPTRGSQLNAVAVNANGDAAAAWDQFTYNNGGGATIGAAVQAGGRWGAPFTISGTTGFSTTPKVAVGADGTMAISWVYQDPVATTTPAYQKIQVAVKPAQSTTWTTYELDHFVIGGVAITTPVPVAIDANGNVTAAWTNWDGVRHQVRTSTLAKGASAWGPTATLSELDDGLYFSLAVNAQGDAAIVYSLSPYTTYSTGTNAKFVFRSRAGGGWTSPVAISETLMSWVGYITGPQVALDANGLATVIYMGNAIEATRQVRDANAVGGARWTTPAPVLVASYAGSSYMSADLAVDNAGNAVAALSIFDATVGVDRASAWVTRGTPDGNWTPQQRLTDPTVPVDAYATRVAISPDGALALVGWIDHYHGVVQVSQFDAAATAWGAAKTIGRGTAFASFQEVLGLAVGSKVQARAIWKNTAKGGTRTMAASYR